MLKNIFTSNGLLIFDLDAEEKHQKRIQIARRILQQKTLIGRFHIQKCYNSHPAYIFYGRHVYRRMEFHENMVQYYGISY